MESVTLPDYLTFQTLQRPLLQLRLLQKVPEIAPAIKGRIHIVTKESQYADHAVIKIRMNCTANEGSPGIYIHWGKTKNKEKLRLSFYYREETSPNY